jgi:hypothetical protein
MSKNLVYAHVYYLTPVGGVSKRPSRTRESPEPPFESHAVGGSLRP